ncbi:MAG: hypothetical protein DRP83_01570 [Planctomycetota bacterium]|nr:MAG: hypothetical protein DRP83_01570 [Planctomycetota bacterium]
MSIKPSKFVLEHAPWSYSKAETAAQCPYRFFLTYVEKRKRGTPNADALVGQAVHTILEFMISGRNWNLAYEAAREKYADMTSNEIDRVEEMRFAAENFIGKLGRYQDRHNIQDTWIERKLGVTLEGKPTKFFGDKVFFRGVVDLALFPKDRGHVIVLDHKTGKRRSLHYYEKQFDCYLLLIKAALKTLTRGRVGIHWAKEDYIELSKKSRDIADIQPFQEQLIKWLNKSVEKTADNFKQTRRGPLCPWCDHQSVCPEFSQGSDTDNACGKEEEG